MHSLQMSALRESVYLYTTHSSLFSFCVCMCLSFFLNLSGRRSVMERAHRRKNILSINFWPLFPTPSHLPSWSHYSIFNPGSSNSPQKIPNPSDKKTLTAHLISIKCTVSLKHFPCGHILLLFYRKLLFYLWERKQVQIFLFMLTPFRANLLVFPSAKCFS